MRKTTKCLLLALCFLGSAVGEAWQSAAKAPGCDADDKSKWEWVYHFPQQNQKGKALRLTQEALASKENVRPGYESWLSGRALGILNTPQIPEMVSEFTVYRDCQDAARVSVVEAKPANSDSVTKRPSKKRRVLASTLGFGAPVSLGILTGGAAALPYVLSGVPNMFFGGRRTNDSQQPNAESKPFELYPGMKITSRPGYSAVKLD